MPRVRPLLGKKRTWQCPFCEHRPFKRRDMYELHVKESHPDVVAAPPMHEAPAGNNGDNDDDPREGSSGGARPPVDHSLSGPPEPAARYPFWDWDPHSRGRRVRLAIPDVAPLRMGASIEAECEALQVFINTQCAPILRGIGPDTAVRPAELEAYETARQILDERNLYHVMHFCYHVKLIYSCDTLFVSRDVIFASAVRAALARKGSVPGGTGRAQAPRHTSSSICCRG